MWDALIGREGASAPASAARREVMDSRVERACASVLEYAARFFF